ncbi:MAG: Uma2 family endonuclease [Runella slithyformis]|nr:MAG: Uma2 family endonuclease [Runella slithyformis]
MNKVFIKLPCHFPFYLNSLQFSNGAKIKKRYLKENQALYGISNPFVLFLFKKITTKMVATLAPELTYSIEDYFELEAQSLEKLEYYNGTIITMPGASYVHNRIATNVLTLLNIALQSTNYEANNSDTKIHIPKLASFVYPDAVVICEKPEFYKNRADIITNPLLVVEVVSPSTEDYDRGEKFYLYRTLPSFKQYVVVHQNWYWFLLFLNSTIKIGAPKMPPN